MEILYSFKTKENENVSFIFEIKYFNLSADAPKSDKYKWYIYSNKELRNLLFKEMADKTRSFQCGLFLDMENLKISIDNYTENIEKCQTADNDFIFEVLSKNE